MISPMARSAIPAISHDLLDLGPMGNSHIPQCPVVVFRQGGDGLLDLALATPLCPSACDGAPDHGQPTRVDKSVSVDLARRRSAAVSRGRHPRSRCSSIDSALRSSTVSGTCGRRNERNGFPSFAPGELLVPPSTNLAGDRRYRSRRKPVQRSTVEGKTFEEKPKHRRPDRAPAASLVA